MNRLLNTYLLAVNLNPLKGVEDKVQALNNKIDYIIYWVNPENWFKELWSALDVLFKSGNVDVFLLVATVAGIWLIMLGAEKPKKLLFWGWIAFWALRKGVFNV